MKMSDYLAIGGIILVMFGSWLVAYEVVLQFRGQSHIVSVAYGGPGTPKKLPEFIAYEARRNKFMWTGLVLITVGSLVQIAAVFCA
jgi:hypothetical protein